MTDGFCDGRGVLRVMTGTEDPPVAVGRCPGCEKCLAQAERDAARARTKLKWYDGGKKHGTLSFHEAVLGDFEGGDGARFSITPHPTCHRRGQHKLLIEVTPSWGCFDEADQPMRWYHDLEVAFSEAQRIADAIVPR